MEPRLLFLVITSLVDSHILYIIFMISCVIVFIYILKHDCVVAYYTLQSHTFICLWHELRRRHMYNETSKIRALVNTTRICQITRLYWQTAAGVVIEANVMLTTSPIAPCTEVRLVVQLLYSMDINCSLKRSRYT